MKMKSIFTIDVKVKSSRLRSMGLSIIEFNYVSLSLHFYDETVAL